MTPPLGPTGPPHVVLVTCRTWPELSTSDAVLADELRDRGCVVTGLAWNDAPVEKFLEVDVVVLRSNWDYHHDMVGFTSWLDAIESGAGVVQNPLALVRSTLDKGHALRHLADSGVRIPRTLTVRLDGPRDGGTVSTDPTPTEVGSWVEANGLERVVIKPAYGASGHDVELVDDRGSVEAACRARMVQADARPFLVQEFVPQIRDGEVSLVYFAGEFSHAFRRTPVASDFRVNGAHGGTTSHEPAPGDDRLAFAGGVLDTLPVVPTYARVDVVGSTLDDLVLMELEINEPALGLHLAPGSAARFADAILRV